MGPPALWLTWASYRDQAKAAAILTLEQIADEIAVADENASERTHPTYFPLLEQWEKHTQAIQALAVGQAFIRLPDDSVHRVRTPTLPEVTVSPGRVEAVQRHYLRTYFRPVPTPAAPATVVPPPAQPTAPARAGQFVPIRRHHPRKHPTRSPGPVSRARPRSGRIRDH